VLVDNFIKVSTRVMEEERAARIRESKAGRVVRCFFLPLPPTHFSPLNPSAVRFFPATPSLPNHIHLLSNFSTA
jgi:hypothetical protein